MVNRGCRPTSRLTITRNIGPYVVCVYLWVKCWSIYWPSSIILSVEYWLSVSWQINQQLVIIYSISNVSPHICEWLLEYWSCLGQQSASPVQHFSPQSFFFCYKVPVKWHVVDTTAHYTYWLLRIPDWSWVTKYWAIFVYWSTSRLSVSTHQSLCWFSVSGVLYWLTCWTKFDQGIGRYMDQVSVKSRWSDRDQSAK